MGSIQIIRYTLLFIILIVITSCKQNNQRKQYGDDIIPTSTYYRPSKLIDSLTKIFLDSAKCSDCLNEIYIDKVYINESYITFRAITYNNEYYNEYLNKQKPLFYFIKNGKKVFVFTGAEEYIFGNQGSTGRLVFSDENRTKLREDLSIQFKIIKDSVYLHGFHKETVYMLRVAGAPFMPEFDQTPLPPDDSIPPFDPKKYYSN